MNGMTQTCAMGPIRNAVIGDAPVSSICANPNTRPCSLNGTTRWMIVCSDASTTGISAVYRTNPMTRSTMDDRIGNTMQMIHSTALVSSNVRVGFDPRPLRATVRPPAMKPKLTTPKSSPHASTETSVRP